jgi:hypothetical protein
MTAKEFGAKYISRKGKKQGIKVQPNVTLEEIESFWELIRRKIKSRGYMEGVKFDIPKEK